MPAPYTFEFRLTASEVRRAIRTSADLPSGQALEKSVRRQWLRWLPLAVALSFLATWGVVTIIESIFGPMHVGIPLAMSSAAALVVLAKYARPLLSKRHMRMVIESMIDQQNAGLLVPGVIGQMSITLNEAGVACDAVGTSSWVAWAGVSEVRETDEFIIIESVQGRWLILPKGSISTLAPVSEVVAYADRCIAESGGVGTLIDLYMESHSMPCPVCEYPLGPARIHRCPECGREIELEDLRV